MPNTIVKNWFADQFLHLHPLLQELHTQGGTLIGNIELRFGSGLAGIIGHRLAKKMDLPEQGFHQLMVKISHNEHGLHWSRRFNNTNTVTSLFKPTGNIHQGYWIETTGPLSMKLTVDIKDGGWFWRCLSVRFFGIPIPKWLVPHTNAYKTMEDDQYRFHVEFSLPMIGSLVCYRGLLHKSIT